ncbi:MAG: flagellar hook-length control protein FliK [Propionivibrio sp.]|nr:flagellar hook-length control protein FliK [Propionivibrio sp.]
MIPADVTSRMQVSADPALRPVAPSQEIADKLPGLVAGQKIMAEIQSLLPNGTYRALINQRSITLALPFSAKGGDALELQVTESDGKLTLAVASRREGEGGKPMTESASATLSRAGQLIGTLFSAAREAKGSQQALPLNANQPISAAPTNAQDLLPLLKQAITQSGMFYESHQAEWVEGRFTKAALLQEPQGKLSSPAAFASASVEEQASTAQPKAAVPNAGMPPAASRLAADLAQTQGSTVDGGKTSATLSPAQAPAQLVAPQAHLLVQQQLEALATQNFSWQGQVWPGQDMRWEIDEDAARPDLENEETAPKWTTRVHLTLPNLGEIDAQIRLQGQQIALTMSSGDAQTRELMRASSLALRSQLDEAGLTLASMGVDAATESRDGQAGG